MITWRELFENIKGYISGDYPLTELNRDMRFFMEDSGHIDKDIVLKDVEAVIPQIEYVDMYYFLMTFLMQVTESPKVIQNLLSYALQDDSLSKENQFFLYGQINRFLVFHLNSSNDVISSLLDAWYDKILAEYTECVEYRYIDIPKEDRNENLVFVMTSQLIGMGHGPTKTLLDRCYVLQKELHKNVFIINTAEMGSRYNAFPIFMPSYASYVKELNDVNQLEYLDQTFSYFQCPNEMPNGAIIQQILDIVAEEKPYYIVHIGGGSIACDLCSRIVPTLAVGTQVTARVNTRGQFQSIGRLVTENDLKWRDKHGLNKDHFIQSQFTWSVREKTHTYTREQLGLPQDAFIMLVVGSRLDIEIEEDFLEMLDRCFEMGLHVAFMGYFDRYATIAEERVCFREQTTFLGFQEDVLAVNECCDLFINPRRVGGGTSAIEAMVEGVPVVSIAFGDVGDNVGEEYVVPNYDCMYERIMKYVTDQDYYNEMSAKVKIRAAELMDSSREFVRVLDIMESSDSF